MITESKGYTLGISNLIDDIGDIIYLNHNRIYQIA